MRDLDRLAVVVEDELEVLLRDEYACVRPGRVGELPVREPEAGPDRRSWSSSLELDPDAVTFLGERDESVARACEGERRQCGGRQDVRTVDRRHRRDDLPRWVVVQHL